MKLTRREQMLVGVLSIVLVIGGGYFGIIKPQIENFNKIKSEHEALNVKYTEFVASLSPTNKLYNTYTIMNNKTQNVTKLFFPEIKQQKFILILKDQIEKAQINPKVIQFTNVEDIKLEAEEEKDKADQADKLGDAVLAIYTNKLPIPGQDTKTPEQEAIDKERKEQEELLNSLSLQTATLVFEGSYSQLKSFISQVEMNDKRITVESIMSTRVEGNLEHTVILGFYAMKKIDQEQDKAFLAWETLGVYGKADPFSGIDLSNLKTESTAASSAFSSDFFMSLNSVVSDMTTVMLSKDGDRTRRSFVYADSNSEEPVTIEFIQKEGKYYYRYKTSSEQYPLNYDEFVEFKPTSNNISILVASSVRTGKDDKSGVKLTIINKTDRAVAIKSSNDDMKPRLVIVKKQGSVNLVK